MNKLNVALAACLGAALLSAASGCRGWESTEPPVHWNPNMDTQEKGKAFRKSDFFSDGRMMRPAIPGTVARGFLKNDDLRTNGVDEAGEPSKAFPGGHESWAATLGTGKKQYGVYCAPCHGHALDGLGTVSAKLAVKAPSLLEQRIKDFPVGRVYQAIKNGVNQGNMGSYASQLSETDRWAVSYYVRSMQIASDPKVEWEGGRVVVVQVATVASVEHGASLYEAKGCNACHSIDGSPKVGPSFKGLYGKTENTDKGPVVADAAYITESILNPMAKVVVGYPPAMPPQVGLSDVDLQSLVMFVESLK